MAFYLIETAWYSTMTRPHKCELLLVSRQRSRKLSPFVVLHLVAGWEIFSFLERTSLSRNRCSAALLVWRASTKIHSLRNAVFLSSWLSAYAKTTASTKSFQWYYEEIVSSSFLSKLCHGCVNYVEVNTKEREFRIQLHVLSPPREIGRAHVWTPVTL